MFTRRVCNSPMQRAAIRADANDGGNMASLPTTTNPSSGTKSSTDEVAVSITPTAAITIVQTWFRTKRDKLIVNSVSSS